MSRAHLILWIASLALYLLILFRALHERTLRRYKAFHTYIVFATVVSLVRMFIYWKFGYASSEYYYGYHLTNLPTPIFQLVILFDLYGRFIGYSKISWKSSAKFITVAAVMAAPLAWKILGLTNFSFFLRYNAFMLLLQVAACFMVFRAFGARRDLDFGRNLKGILMGIASLVALQTINFATLLLGGGTYLLFSFLTPFIYFLALAAFAYTLWNFDPVRKLEPADEQRFDKINQDLQQAVRTFLSPR